MSSPYSAVSHLIVTETSGPLIVTYVGLSGHLLRFHVCCSLFTDNMTGSQSLHTVYQGHEIMFHVSTLLPITPDNPQQVG